ncbi:peptidase inhibitor family I36 protein [Micromonospora parva]|uniref:peptidase inhibitor family I36 protein n=1 Tax=Micromonospora parva TaxID=1464048 RepID=UPI0033F17B78
MTNRRLILRMMAVALAFAGAGIAAAPASAASCPSNSPCFWDNANRGGNWVHSTFTSSVGSAYNDKASSFQNNTSGNVIWYWNSGCSGNVAMVLSSGAWQNASWYNNDETSSVCRG